jgi:hypothetical protein
MLTLHVRVLTKKVYGKILENDSFEIKFSNRFDSPVNSSIDSPLDSDLQVKSNMIMYRKTHKLSVKVADRNHYYESKILDVKMNEASNIIEMAKVHFCNYRKTLVNFFYN